MQRTEYAGFIEILDRSLRLYRTHFNLIVAVAAVLLLPLNIILATLMQVFLGPLFAAAHLTANDPSRFIELLSEYGGPQMLLDFGVVFFAYALLAGLVAPLATGALVCALDAGYRRRPITLRESYEKLLEKVWPYLGAVLMRGLILGFGFFACVIPGVWAFLVFSQVEAATLLEDRTSMEALSRSRELMTTDGAKLRCFLLAAMLIVVSIVVNQIFKLGYTLIVGDSPDNFYASMGLAAIAQLLMVPLQTAVIVVFFHELKIFREATDLEEEAIRLGLHDEGDTAFEPHATSSRDDGFPPLNR